MVSIREIAQKTGVSNATLSKAPNFTGELFEATRKRNQKLAARFNVQPNAFARKIYSCGNHRAGFVIARAPNLFLSNPISFLVLSLQNFSFPVEKKAAANKLIVRQFTRVPLS